MAKIDDLLEEVGDVKLRAELRRAVKELRNSRNFGLVFEEHIPEEVALPGLPVRQGSIVQIRTRPGDTTKYEVLSLDSATATIRPVSAVDHQPEEIETGDLMVVRRFGEPIYPGLTEVGSIRRGPDDKPAHAVINAENFHALQLLTYTHAGKVDVIYIDPPYNTGDKSWKYNNRFVDSNDQWRHSKWLSMIEKRLKLAKLLLKLDGVLIVTIDEHEFHHLRVLLEQLFPESRHQIVTIVTNPKGVDQSGFSRVDEYALYVIPPGRQVSELPVDFLRDKVLTADSGVSPWLSLLRRGNNSRPADRPNLCYPIAVNPSLLTLVGYGPTLKERLASNSPAPEEYNQWDPPTGETIKGYPVMWPRRSNGDLGTWSVGGPTLMRLAGEGYVRVSSFDPDREQGVVNRLSEKARRQIEVGDLVVVGHDSTGAVTLKARQAPSKKPQTVWSRTSHDAGTHGSTLLANLLGRSRSFMFPKSLYSTLDTLRTVIQDNRNAVVLDFFAGSGTTLHATALLNASDGGTRGCILVTNNELSDQDQRALHSQRHYPGDPVFEQSGVFESVTRPRIEAAVTGKRIDGSPVPGRYLESYLDADLSAGLDESVTFFRLDYLDPDVVGLGRQYRAIAPLLWLAAGAVGEWADRESDEPWSAPPSSNYAVLFDEDRFSDFREMLEKQSDRISHVWLVTNSSQSFVEMRAQLSDGLECGMLYRDYLLNFRVNTTETFE